MDKKIKAVRLATHDGDKVETSRLAAKRSQAVGVIRWIVLLYIGSNSVVITAIECIQESLESMAGRCIGKACIRPDGGNSGCHKPEQHRQEGQDVTSRLMRPPNHYSLLARRAPSYTLRDYILCSVLYKKLLNNFTKKSRRDGSALNTRRGEEDISIVSGLDRNRRPNSTV